MKHNVVTPSVGESITEVGILKWNKQSGQRVKPGEVLVEIESDKATVEVAAETGGVLQIMKQAGDRLPIGAVIAVIDTEGKETVASAAPAAASASKPASPAPAAPMQHAAAGYGNQVAPGQGMGPAARKMVAETGADATQIAGTGKGGRVTKGDVIQHGSGATAARAPMPAPATTAYDKPGDRRVPMSMLRQKIAERLVTAQQTAAILTTFNEVDLSKVMALRNQHKDAFKAKHGVNLSFMSFFTLASIKALKEIPEVNATIDGRDVVYHDYYDIGIAVGTERGLVVPVIRGAEKMGFVEIEKKLGELAVKARDGKLSISDMAGGTFTISNGGTYGSMLSTPILNYPQSGILGMHKIMERPVAVDGKIEIRPMMYLALSYDHRLIDGKGAVTFLVKLKETLEKPESLGPL